MGRSAAEPRPERQGPSEEQYCGPGKKNDDARLLAELLRRREKPLPCTQENLRDLWCSDDPDERVQAKEICGVCPMEQSCPFAGKVKSIVYNF